MANKFIIEIRTKGFKGAEQDLNKVKTATTKYTKESRGMRLSTTKVRREIGKMRNDLLLLSFGIGSAVLIVKKFIDAAAGFEAVKTRLVGLTGSVQGAEKAFQTFNEVAATTPFTLQDVVEAGAQLTAFGVNAEEMIKPVTDLAAFMGTTATEAANSLGRAFAGGAGAADILRERGILNLIKTTQGLDDLSKTTLPQFRDALINTLQDPIAGIAGSTDRMSETFVGAMSNMQDSLTRLSAAIGEHMLPALKQTGEGFGIIANWFESKLKKSTEDTISEFIKFDQVLITNQMQLEMWQFKLDKANETIVDLDGNLTFMNANQSAASRMVELFALRIQRVTDAFIAQELPMQEFTLRTLDASQVFFELSENLEKVDIDTLKLTNSLDFLNAEQTFLVKSTKQIADNFALAALNGQNMGDAVVSALKAISAQIIADMVIYAMLQTFTGGTFGAATSFLEFAFGHTGGLVKENGIQKFAHGGMVQGQDNVPILAQAGEFIMKREAVQDIGVSQLAQMNRSGSAGVTINVQGNMIGNESFVRDVLIPEISNAQRLNLA